MKIMIVSGSHRQESQSLRVSQYVAEDLARIDPTVVLDIFSLSGNPLPLWDESAWNNKRDIWVEEGQSLGIPEELAGLSL